MCGGTAQRYGAYLLRCWQEGKTPPGKEQVWRFSLEEVGRERRRRGFGDLEGLVTFLRAEVMGAQSELSQEKD